VKSLYRSASALAAPVDQAMLAALAADPAVVALGRR
jgi:hypothetical protein